MGEVLSVEEVLAAEADATHGKDWRAQVTLQDQSALQERAWLNADDRDSQELPPGEAERRAKLYRALNKLNRAALCCSGGGIRSSTFCLGVIQALAGCDTSKTGSPAVAEKSEAKPEDSLLGCIDYLSTVSGGGYVGSWLSSWRYREDFDSVISNLIGRPDGADVESPHVSWLRSYSNYLTPRLGIASADSWAAVAITVRNLVLNWLVIIPVVCLVLLALKIIAALGVWTAREVVSNNVIYLLLAGCLCLIVAQSFTSSHRPSRRGDKGNVNEFSFLLRNFAWAFASAILLTIFFTSYYSSLHVFGVNATPDLAFLAFQWTGLSIVKQFGFRTEFLLLTAIAGFFVYLAGWILGLRLRRAWPDLLYWAVSGLVYGALVGVGAYLFHSFEPYKDWPNPAPNQWYVLLPIIFGVPWMLLSQLTADNIFIGLASYEVDGDSDREWLGRAAGWLAAGAIAWALVAFLAFTGDYLVQAAEHWTDKVVAEVVAAGGITGILSGIITAVLGGSAKTPAKESDQQKSRMALIYNAVLAVTGPLFAAILIIALSVGLDKLLLGPSLVAQMQVNTATPWPLLKPLSIGFGIALAVALLASYFVNINRFSLHALYRNRLIRAYLGASRHDRHPDLFTGFYGKDNVRMHELWPPKPDTKGANSHSLFHVINIALNVVATKRKAWQQRKAEPFTVSPLHSGSWYLGYRSSETYGDGVHADEYTKAKADEGRKGISLGTAMAISGAAVSPNMGYHSSPSITLLLTLFNVRLGWWLGSPGERGGKTYKKEGPEFAVWPLLQEAFGQTTDRRSYVYLSDGGHFENLGLYEMVRRRCRLIIVIDAGCDPHFAFEDLGNAVRKIYIDLGIRIEFDRLEDLQNHPSRKSVRRIADGGAVIPYCAIGTIFYKCADGEALGCADGRILYIKPAYHGTESAGIRSYATANPAFPHESTSDQWFTESQFESYRALGFEIANHMFDEQEVQAILNAFLGNRTPARQLEHDPEKWSPVFRKDHAQTKSESGMPIQP